MKQQELPDGKPGGRSLGDERHERLVLGAMLGVVLLFWTAFPVLTQLNFDPFQDMLENYAWGIAWQFGYYKHPPLFAWLVAAWFSVMPRVEWVYFLFSALNITVSLAILLLVARRYLDRLRLRLVVPAALLVPPLGFFATNYNANSAMLPFWALAFLFYLRVIERRRAGDALMFGVACGLACLAKYTSALLVLSFVLHAVFDRDMRWIWKTALPVFATASGAAVIAPHVAWLFFHDFMPLHFALYDQGARDADNVLWSLVMFAGAQIAYLVPGFAVLGLWRRPGDGLPLIETSEVVALASRVAGRALLVVAVAPFVAMMVASIALSVPLTSTWTVPFFLLPLIPVVLFLPRGAVERYPGRALQVVIGVSVVILALSPLLYRNNMRQAYANTAMPVAAIAHALDGEWQSKTGDPLRIALGDLTLSNAMTFYAEDRPFAVQGTNLRTSPWVTPDDIVRDGALTACFTPACDKQARDVIGKADFSGKLTVPAVDGAGGPSKWTVIYHIRLPEKGKDR